MQTAASLTDNKENLACLPQLSDAWLAGCLNQKQSAKSDIFYSCMYFDYEF